MDRTEAFVRVFEKVYGVGRGIDSALGDVDLVMAKLFPEQPAPEPQKAPEQTSAKPTRK